MADKIHFQIATADGVVCDSMVCYALVPLSDGDVGVLSDHAPMIGALKEGVVKYVSEGEDHFAAISGGVLSVADNEVILLARTAERAETIDLARAQASERRARQRLESRAANVDLKRAELSLQRAIAREKAYTMLHKYTKKPPAGGFFVPEKSHVPIGTWDFDFIRFAGRRRDPCLPQRGMG